MGEALRVLYGTETGTAEMCGSDLVDALKKRGYAATLTDMDDYELADLAHERLVIVITSTFGNGDPPANAEILLEGLRNDRPDLSGIPYAVLALGDSSYPHFAQCGRDFFEVIGELGAHAILPRKDCDGDVDVPFAAFQKDLLAHLESHAETFPKGGVGPAKKGMFARLRSWIGGNEAAPTPTTMPTKPSIVDRHNPATGTLTSTRLLSGDGSTKETRHYVLDLGSDHGLRAGDSIGVYAKNPPSLIDAVLTAANLEAHADTLRPVLATRCLRRVTPRLLESIGAAQFTDNEQALSAYLATHHVLHALRDLKPTLDPQTFVDGLHPLAPRLYSVANDSTKGPVDLCIETTRYTFEGVETAGVASCWFADQLKAAGTISWYPHKNPAFHVPAGDAPLILVGPGTGVAPFRGFLQQLAGSGRRTWLFFGHRNAASDDLYKEEFAAHLKAGHLSRYDVAWSRDQEQRIYVQQRIAAAAEDLWSWLQEGAIVMVCGAAVGMAPGVRDAFAEIASAHGEDGVAWLEARRAAKTYLEDVY